MRYATYAILAVACVVLAAGRAEAQPATGPIGPGDLVYIEVRGVPELTSTVQVNPSGNVRVTYVGEVHVGGLTESQAAAAISESLRSMLRNPRVTVMRNDAVLGSMPMAGRTDEMRTEIVPLHNANAENLAMVLRGMSSSGGRISFDRDTNTLILTDKPSALQNIMNIAARMDQMQAQLTQVRIETKIVEVRVGAIKELGLRWFVGGDHLGGGFYPPGTQSSQLNNLKGNLSPNASEALGSDDSSGGSGGGGGREFIGGREFGQRLQIPVQVPLLGQGFLSYVNAGIDIGAMLDALVSEDKAKILANPMLLTVNHQTATIKMVDEFPVLEFGTDLSGASLQSFDFMELGIVMEVTPHVYQDSGGTYVKMELRPEVSFPSGSANGVPIRSVRSSETVASVRDGQTLVVGGIMREEERQVDTHIAGIGKIPVIGLLFKHKERTSIRTELMIFVTPTVHRRPEDITLDKMLNLSKHLSKSDWIPLPETAREARKE